MAKLKIKKNDVWIDMTPMSDVMVLLLTFFMLSANFVKNEVVKVETPSSQTESKVPKNATLDIMIKPDTLFKGQGDKEKIVGRVFLGTDKVSTMDSALNKVILQLPNYKGKVNLSEEAKKAFLAETQIGIAIVDLPAYLGKTHEERTKDLKAGGVNLDSIIDITTSTIKEIPPGKYSEFELWVRALRIGYQMWWNGEMDKMSKNNSSEAVIKEFKEANPERLEICIKADRQTPYMTFKSVISELQDLNLSKYKLLTQYKKPVEEKKGK